MRRLLAIAFLLLPLAVQAQEGQQEALPGGWRATPMPILGYHTDHGFLFGASTDIYNYGRQPSLYPGYRQKIHCEISHFTGGRTFADIEYDDPTLIPGVRLSASMTAQIDPLYNFYGFGGDVTTYDRSIDRNGGVAFYSYKRNFFHIQTAMSGWLSPHLRWNVSLAFRRYLNGEISDSRYDPGNTLFHLYRTSGIIRDNETDGSFLEFKGGISYDSRDNWLAPSRGISADLFLVGDPDIFRTGYSFLQLCAHFRHYVTPGPDWLTIAFHLAWQGTVAGEAPFYMQQNIHSLHFTTQFSEGLGGYNTLRGLLNSRLVGDGYAWANFELRCRLFSWTIAGMECFLGVNPFFDMGMITNPYRLDEIAATGQASYDELKSLATRLHKSAGAGLKFGLGDIYILSLEAGKSFSRNDGPMNLAVSINYIF